VDISEPRQLLHSGRGYWISGPASVFIHIVHQIISCMFGNSNNYGLMTETDFKC